MLAGDYNVAATDLDIYPTSSWDEDAFIHPESRTADRELVGRSWIDALRQLPPENRVCTFWPYKRLRRQRDAGPTLDHLLLSRHLADRLVEASVTRQVRGLFDMEEASLDYRVAGGKGTPARERFVSGRAS